MNKLSVFCIITGVMIGMILKGYSVPDVLKVKIFQRGEGKPAVMRIYKPGIDGFLVEDTPGRYIPLNDYLRSIKNKYDREIEELTIKKVAAGEVQVKSIEQEKKNKGE